MSATRNEEAVKEYFFHVAGKLSFNANTFFLKVFSAIPRWLVGENTNNSEITAAKKIEAMKIASIILKKVTPNYFIKGLVDVSLDGMGKSDTCPATLSGMREGK